MAQRGFILDTTDLIPDRPLDPDARYGYLLAQNGLPSKLEGRGDFLTQATKGALNYLAMNEKGFFLMVEGSQIDWEGHHSNY